MTCQLDIGFVATAANIAFVASSLVFVDNMVNSEIYDGSINIGCLEIKYFKIFIPVSGYIFARDGA